MKQVIIACEKLVSKETLGILKAWLDQEVDPGEGEEIEMPEFNVERMERLVEKDKFLNMVVVDLHKKNPIKGRSYILEVVFNGFILEDSVMEHEYECI